MLWLYRPWKSQPLIAIGGDVSRGSRLAALLRSAMVCLGERTGAAPGSFGRNGVLSLGEVGVQAVVPSHRGRGRSSPRRTSSSWSVWFPLRVRESFSIVRVPVFSSPSREDPGKGVDGGVRFGGAWEGRTINRTQTGTGAKILKST